jgi:hypothetical protein
VNQFRADVRALDAVAFLAHARLSFALAAAGVLAAMLAWPRLRRPGWLLALVLAGNAWVWLETSWPLQRLYALGPSSDRINNVALCQVVAAGGSPLRTPQVGTAHFEPFWALLVAALSGWDAARLLRLYASRPRCTSRCARAAGGTGRGRRGSARWWRARRRSCPRRRWTTLSPTACRGR